MTKQLNRANTLNALHSKGNPLILCNVWDAGSAKRLAQAGAQAIATSSWAVAAAQGYGDGQQLPFDRVLATVAGILRVTDLPVTVDLEAGYGLTPQEIQAAVGQVVSLGAVGINLEDRIVGQDALHACAEHCERLHAARQASAIPIFINARTDVFFLGPTHAQGAAQLDEVLMRATAYAEAGADGLFVPGLRDEASIEALCQAAPLPVNIMIGAGSPSPTRLAALGVARISYGPLPYLRAMEAFEAEARRELL